MTVLVIYLVLRTMREGVIPILNGLADSVVDLLRWASRLTSEDSAGGERRRL